MIKNNIFLSKLAAELEQKKIINPNYSMRALSRDINITPSELSRIMAYKRNLSPQLAYKIGQYLKLPQEEMYQLVLSTLSDT